MTKAAQSVLLMFIGQTEVKRKGRVSVCSSDKFYSVYLSPQKGNLWKVTVNYGRNGCMGIDETKLASVDYITAQSYYDALICSKIKKGYDVVD